MSVQINHGDNKTAQTPIGGSPVRKFHLLAGSSETTLYHNRTDPGRALTNLDSVGIKEFIYYPQCSRTEQVIAPQDYHMFILTKPNSLYNIILIRHSFLREADLTIPYTPFPPVVHRLTESWAITHRLSMFYQEAKSDYPGKTILLHDLAQIITALLLRSIAKPAAIPPAKRKTKDIGLALDYIHNYYYTAITLEDLARRVNYSQYHFIRIFKKETGRSPFEYLTDFRLEKAREFLSTTKLSIIEISLQCGFQNSSHFANVFKLHTGISPSKYRQGTSS